MNMTESILNYRQYLKRKNFSPLTIKNYLHRLQRFFRWVSTAVELMTVGEIRLYIDYLLEKRIAPRSINCHLSSIRLFYDYLRDEENLIIKNPVISGLLLKEARPLPRYLTDNEVDRFFRFVSNKRDFAIFMLMLRCGLRVNEIANLSLDCIDYRRSRIMVRNGKGAKDRIVFISNDAASALAVYLQRRPVTKENRIFLAEKGRWSGKPISVRAIQKRVEYYARTSEIPVTCHRFRHTMATQLLNADADLVSIQEILGHTKIKTTQRYSKLSNLKVQQDYFTAMEKITERASVNQFE